MTYTAAATAVYATVSSPAVTESTLPILAVRLVALAGVAVCGNIYWRIESNRRQAAAEHELHQSPPIVSTMPRASNRGGAARGGTDTLRVHADA